MGGRQALALRLATLLLLALPVAARAQERSIRLREFDALVDVSTDGSFEVTERLLVRFDGSWNGITRDLSLQHRTGDGRPAKLRVEIESITDSTGKALRFEEEDTEDSGMRRFRIWVPGAQNAERRVVIRYRVKNGIRFFYAGSDAGSLDELYWNVTGNLWEMPIDRARVRVVLPPGVPPAHVAVYTGAAGSLASAADVERLENGLIATTRGVLEPYEGLTVAVGWPPGAIAGRVSERQHRIREALRYWPLAIPLLVFAFAFRSWSRRGRDPKPETIVVQYEPPDGLSPAELGTLMDHRAEMRDITATLVDLAVRGFIRIEEQTERRMLGLIKDTDFAFFLLRPRAEWSGLAPHEELYLDGLFRYASSAATTRVASDGDGSAPPRRPRASGEEKTVRLSDLENRFHAELPKIRDAIYDNLVRRGYYSVRPDRVKHFWLLGAFALLALGVLGAGFATGPGAAWMSNLAVGAAGAASAIIVFVFAWVMPARTPAGARAREKVIGFREFLSRVESERYRHMITSPEMFERYLPHAMALGEQEHWARAFEDIVREPPGWYSGTPGSHFRASSFSSQMGSLSNTASSTMSSTPSSSGSGSGSGGGGSSGGGSGGGGGGGF